MDMREQMGLTVGPAAVDKAIAESRAPIPQPGEPEFDAFREGAAFAVGMLFVAMQAEQFEGGALTDLCERHSKSLAALLDIWDEKVFAAMGVDCDTGEPLAKPEAAEEQPVAETAE